MMSDMLDRVVGKVDGRIGKITQIVGEMHQTVNFTFPIHCQIRDSNGVNGEHPQQEGRRQASKSASDES
jgi:hypothetical protein